MIGIINTGGTFNKRYDPIRGELFVPKDDVAIEAVLSVLHAPYRVDGILYKDSLEMIDSDRESLGTCVAHSQAKRTVIIHGTDTMDLSAEYVAGLNLDKTVVFTGAMVPFSIDPIEAAANVAMALGYAQNAPRGVYIVMQGLCGDYRKIRKNKKSGVFEYV